MAADIVIDELPIPAGPDDPTFAGYARMLEVRNAHGALLMGAAAPYTDPIEALPAFQDQAHMRQRIFVGRLDGEIVAQASMKWSTGPGTHICWVFGGVLPGARRRGVGTALFDHVEGIAYASGRPVIQSFALHEAIAGDHRLTSPTGFGSLPLDDPGVRFLGRRNYELCQIHRVSLLRLPVAAIRVDALHREATTLARGAYDTVTWVGPAPGHWLADLAVLFTHMGTDTPGGTLVNEPEAWDVGRVRADEARRAQSGRLSLTAAAVHRSTGRLAGFTRLSAPTDRARPASQEETLVLREHRGHRLGMLMKLANIRQVALASPDSPMIVTGNAEENRHMLNVNEAVGFVPIAYEGAWRKTLA